MAEHKASRDHGDNENAHDDSGSRTVLNEAVDHVEREVQDRDLDDIPHVLVDQRPSGEHAQKLQRSEPGTADAR